MPLEAVDASSYASEIYSGDDGSGWIIQMVSLGSFSVASGAACLTVLAAILTSAKLRRSPHLYVVNALLLALVRSLVSLPLRMMILSRRSEAEVSTLELDSLCRLFTFCTILSQYGILYTLVATSLDCYFTVVHRRLGVHRCSGLVYLPIMLCVWGLAFVTALLEVYGHAEIAECHQSHNAPSALSAVTWFFLMVFVACWAASNLLYLRTYLFMRHYRRMRPSLQGPQINNGWGDHRQGFQWSYPSMSYAVPGVRWLLPSPPKHVFVGVCALLNVACCLLWLPSLMLCFHRFSLPLLQSYDFLFSKVYNVHDAKVLLGFSGGLVVVDDVCSWLEHLPLLVIPVLYVCSCSSFRKVVLNIESSED